MDNNYHIFVVITTIIFYIFLSSKKKDTNETNTDTNIMYLLYVPAILYGGYYFFYTPKPENLGSSVSSDVVPSVKEISIAPISEQMYIPSDDLLSDPYPSSTNSNF